MKQPKSWHADCCRSASPPLVVGAAMSNKRDSASLIQLTIVTGAISMKTSIKSSGHLALAIFCLLSGCATSDYTYTPGDYAAAIYAQGLSEQRIIQEQYANNARQIYMNGVQEQQRIQADYSAQQQQIQADAYYARAQIARDQADYTWQARQHAETQRQLTQINRSLDQIKYGR